MTTAFDETSPVSPAARRRAVMEVELHSMSVRLEGLDRMLNQKYAELKDDVHEMRKTVDRLADDVREVRRHLPTSSGTLPAGLSEALLQITQAQARTEEAASNCAAIVERFEVRSSSVEKALRPGAASVLAAPIFSRGGTTVTVGGGIFGVLLISVIICFVLYVMGLYIKAYREDPEGTSKAVQEIHGMIDRKKDDRKKDGADDTP